MSAPSRALPERCRKSGREIKFLTVKAVFGPPKRSHRGRKIVARCAGGDPLWQGVARGRVRHERFWALLATVGGEAVWGSSSGVLAITLGPESKMSAAGAQRGSTPSRAQLAPARSLRHGLKVSRARPEPAASHYAGRLPLPNGAQADTLR